MILCDIGNTNATFFDGRKIWNLSIDEFNTYEPKEKIYYINVNEKAAQKLSNPLFIDIEPYIKLNSTYIGLGVDRAAACYAINNGLIVDAGSAITLDLMANGCHIGGFIMPGITTTLSSLKNISPRLDIPLNSQVDLECLPQRTQDAISYGVIKPIVNLINDFASGKSIYFTGGDGEFLSRFFSQSLYDRMLIFRGMQRAINENKEILC
ncbi:MULTISPECIES: type III pantothenate kinase [Campylobacter]|uniref:type III pantothenate kinase n=1 Tax=Campylobacter TaxID=194 RepID=UPI002551B2D6|nr:MULTISPECIES: type III pantothenate kinase [Campylobacter]MBE6429496.1 type III pantothenate kinase [Campylobacter sp.]MBQ8819747.1 type III pantothenate kinase [Campylobacter sp.]MDL0095650.1 type III pantothenate kinase [Campylobacter ovis]